jgi:hypothetical protein
MFSGRLAETNIVAKTEGMAIRERFCSGSHSPDGIAAAAMRGGSARNTAESQEIGLECVRTGLWRFDENLSIRHRSRSEGRFCGKQSYTHKNRAVLASRRGSVGPGTAQPRTAKEKARAMAGGGGSSEFVNVVRDVSLCDLEGFFDVSVLIGVKTKHIMQSVFVRGRLKVEAVDQFAVGGFRQTDNLILGAVDGDRVDETGQILHGGFSSQIVGLFM